MAKVANADRCKSCGRRFKRSNPQNGLYWTLLHIAADKLRPGGKQYSAEQLHWYYKSRFLACVDIALPNGKVLAIPNSSADLDVAEFSEYYGKVEADLAERGVYLHELPA